MRAAPPLQVTIERFDQWRAGLAAVMVLAGAISSIWLASIQHDSWFAGWLPRSGAGLLAGLCLCGASSLFLRSNQQPLSLRWDTQQWHVGPAESIGHEPQAGRIRVAIDCGGWMLLRFDDESTVISRPWLRRSRWIPVQRRGFGGAWHSFRCTVYSPRPESGEVPPDQALSASTRPISAE